MRIPRRLLPHTGTTFRLKAGKTPVGTVYGDPIAIPRTQVVRKRAIIRDEFGNEHVSRGYLFADLADDKDGNLAKIVPGTLVRTFPGTRYEEESPVITVEQFDDLSFAYLILRLG